MRSAFIIRPGTSSEIIQTSVWTLLKHNNIREIHWFPLIPLAFQNRCGEKLNGTGSLSSHPNVRQSTEKADIYQSFRKLLKRLPNGKPCRISNMFSNIPRDILICSIKERRKECCKTQLSHSLHQLFQSTRKTLSFSSTCEPIIGCKSSAGEYLLAGTILPRASAIART